MKPTYKAGQAVEVEVYNFEKRKSQATDIPFRYAVEVKGMRLEGFQAAHPDCVRMVKK
jgi:hypothetical protein